MKIEEVRTRAAEIIAETYGPFRHENEGNLFEDVLRAIANEECEDAGPYDFAAEALKTVPGRFDRWYE